VLGLGLLLLRLRLRLRLPGAVGQGPGGYFSLFMAGSDPERPKPANPAQARRVKLNILYLYESMIE
jgi:hypothetical protein